MELCLYSLLWSHFLSRGLVHVAHNTYSLNDWMTELELWFPHGNKGHVFYILFLVLINYVFDIDLYWIQNLVICYLNDFNFLFNNSQASVSPSFHQSHMSLTKLSPLCLFDHVTPFLKTLPWYTKPNQLPDRKLQVLYQSWLFFFSLSSLSIFIALSIFFLQVKIKFSHFYLLLNILKTTISTWGYLFFQLHPFLN